MSRSTMNFLTNAPKPPAPKPVVRVAPNPWKDTTAKKQMRESTELTVKAWAAEVACADELFVEL
jgi:hypothetical protein